MAFDGWGIVFMTVLSINYLCAIFMLSIQFARIFVEFRISAKYFPFELLPETLFAQRAEDIGGPAPGLSKYGPGADSRSQPSFGRSP